MLNGPRGTPGPEPPHFRSIAARNCHLRSGSIRGKILHRFNRQIPMAEPHDDAVLGLRRHFQARRKSLLARVKSEWYRPTLKRSIRQSFENPQVAMHDGGRLTVHWIVVQYARSSPPNAFHDSLQTEAHAEYRNNAAQARREITRSGTPKSDGRPGPGETQDQVWREIQNQLVKRYSGADKSPLRRRSGARSWTAYG